MYAFLCSSTRHTFSDSASDLSLSLDFLWSSQVTTITGEHNYVDPLFLCAWPRAIASILPSTPLPLENGKERIGWQLRRKQQPLQGTRQLRELWLVTYTYIYICCWWWAMLFKNWNCREGYLYTWKSKKSLPYGMCRNESWRFKFKFWLCHLLVIWL